MGLTFNTGPYNAAAEIYGVDDAVMTKIPRSKFQFTVEMTINEAVPLIDESYGRQFNFQKIQSVALPDYSHNLTRVNQYNRVRYVPTRLEVTPSTIVFYDTKDNQWQYLMQAYAAHYFHGHNIDPSIALNNDLLAVQHSGAYGAKAVSSDARYFFHQIKIVQYDTANSGREITMFNPMIVAVNHDRVDYADSTPMMWQIQFQPEHVNFDTFGDVASPEQYSLNRSSSRVTTTRTNTGTVNTNNVMSAIGGIAAADLLLNRGRGVSNVVNSIRNFFR